MENIVNRATVYERHVPHKEFFTDTSGTIEYTLNSLWHRDVELESFSNGFNLAVGCSHTFGLYEQKRFNRLLFFAPHGERMVVYKNGKQEALMPYSEHFDEFKSIDLDTKMYYNSRSVNHLLAFCKSENIDLQIYNNNSIGFLKEHKDLIVDKGADGVHYGEETHKNFAGLFNVKRKDSI